MIKTCYANFLSILKEGYITPGTNYPETNGIIFSALDPNYYRATETDATNELHSGKRGFVGEVIETMNKTSFDDLVQRINSKVVQKIIPDKREELSYTCRKLILQDDSINRSSVVFTHPEIKKEDLDFNDLAFSVFLANFLSFLVSRNEFSPEYLATTKEITEFIGTCYHDFGKQVKSTSKLTISTLNTTNFDNVFRQIHFTGDLSSQKPNNIKFFHLDIINKDFEYKDLEDFLINNIGNYLYSKADQNKSIKDKAEALFGVKAVRQMARNGDINGDELGDLLLYAFLEKVLGAPKLMSGYQLSNASTCSKSNAIHILSINDFNGAPYHQLVFGTSSILNDLDLSIKNSFKTINDIKNNRDEEIGLVESLSFNQLFEPNDAEALKDIIVPSKGSKSRPQMAFGIFIGCDIDIDKQNYSNPDDYKNALEAKLEQTVKNKVPLLEEQIKLYGLENYSLYFYLLPFNRAEQDKSLIMDAIKTGGVN